MKNTAARVSSRVKYTNSMTMLNPKRLRTRPFAAGLSPIKAIHLGILEFNQKATITALKWTKAYQPRAKCPKRKEYNFEVKSKYPY
jgi:hypothetical protein